MTEDKKDNVVQLAPHRKKVTSEPYQTSRYKPADEYLDEMSPKQCIACYGEHVIEAGDFDTGGQPTSERMIAIWEELQETNPKTGEATWMWWVPELDEADE